MTEAASPVPTPVAAPDGVRPRKETSFAGDVLKLVSGTTIAQGIGVLATPLLTRLYGPEAFGTLALFTSITGIIGVVACLRYELAIMLPETDEEAANLLAVSLLAVVGVTLLTIPTVTWGRPLLLRLLNAPQLDPYLWLVPPVIFFGGVFHALNYWNSRTKQFGRLSVVRVVSSASTHLGKLGAGFGGYPTGGMLIGSTLLGSVLSTSMLAANIWRDDSCLFRQSVHQRMIRAGLTRYRRFPLIDIWSALLNTVSWQLPALLLNLYFSPAVVGHYSLGLRVVQLPMSLVGAAIGQVFFQRAAKAHATATLGQAFATTLRRLLDVGMFPVLALAITGRSVFTFAFGPNWAEAGVYAQILAPWVLVWFVSSPMSTVFSVLQRQGVLLRLNAVILTTRFASLFVGGALGHPRVAIALFSGSGLLAYGHLLKSTADASECSSAMLASCFRIDLYHGIMLFVLVALVAARLPDVVISLVVLLTCMVHFSRLAWHNPRFRDRFSALGSM